MSSTQVTGFATNQELASCLYNCAHSSVASWHLISRVASMRMNISVSLRAGLLPALVFGFAHSAFAGIRPSFSLDYCSWHATDIVLVEVTPSPGSFRVVESWKGDLEAGSPVVVPELQPAADAMEIAAYPRTFRGGVDERIPAQRAGARMA